MAPGTTPPYRFGDLLALARRAWVAQMASRLAAAGHPGYRPSDALVLRALARRRLSIGSLGTVLGVSRQAARKVVGALEGRGLVRVVPDTDDARRALVELTAAGEVYTAAVVATLEELSAGLRRRVGDDALATADAVLRALLDDRARADADRLVPPPS